MSDHEGVSERRLGVEPDRLSVTLRSADRDSIVAQARSEHPNECCGVLLGHRDRVERIQPTQNSLRSPVVFEVDPRELLDVLLAAEAASLDVLGYYHSHTSSPAYPSPTDVRYAAGWPDAVHLIVSLADATPSLRAYSIQASAESAAHAGGGEGGASLATRPAVGIRELEVLLR